MHEQIAIEEIADFIVSVADTGDAAEHGFIVLASHDEDNSVCLEAFRIDAKESTVFKITIEKQ